MKLKDLLRDVKVISSNADMETEISSVCYDSRKTCPGCLFVAVVGFESDGHRFIPMAVEKGAAVILCEKPQEGTAYVQVESSRLALAGVSRNFYGRADEEMTMVAVTGTNGKTTSTLLIKHILETKAGAKVGLIGTNSNWIGDEEIPTERTTPESLELHELFRRMADAGCTHCVMEVSSHSLTLGRVDGVRFATGIFTNLTQDHLDFHKTMESYAEAKAMLFDRTDNSIINVDDEWSKTMLDAVTGKLTTFGVDKKCNLRGENIILRPGSISFDAVTEDKTQHIDLAIPGKFSVYNALGVIGACMSIGVSLESCAEALATAKGVKGRVESVHTDGDYTILIDYSHTPDALENVLRAVRETSSGRVVSLFGCGGDRDRLKRPIMGRIGTELADFAIVTSDNPRTEDPDEIIREILTGVTVDHSRYVAITDRRKAIEYAIENHQPGDVIVLAGKGHETYQEINHVKHHMDEREIVAEVLEKRRQR